MAEIVSSPRPDSADEWAQAYNDLCVQLNEICQSIPPGARLPGSPTHLDSLRKAIKVLRNHLAGLDEPGENEFDPPADSLMTPEEWEVYSHLSLAFNAFVKLPVQHVADQSEFAQATNSAKNILMARPVSRELQAIGINGYIDPQSGEVNGLPYDLFDDPPVSVPDSTVSPPVR